MNENKLVSRYFNEDDQNKTIIETIDNKYWYAKKFEYAWASQFVEKNDICLDAGCGMDEHKFKEYLEENAKLTYAIDKDKNISKFKSNKKIKYLHLDLINLDKEFNENTFDKIFCLATFCQMKHNDVIEVLKQMKKLLKKDGKILITVNHPYINLLKFVELVDKAGLNFIDLDTTIYKHKVLRGYTNGLKCFRVCLENINKNEEKEKPTNKPIEKPKENKIDKPKETK